MKIYPTITSVSGHWLEKLKEADKLGLEEVCFFPTCMMVKEREEFYKLLERSSIKKIPLVHLRSDMQLWEMDFLVQKYQTEVFNCHSLAVNPLENDLSKYRKRIFVENSLNFPEEKEMNLYAGLCLDFSHFEKIRLENHEKYLQDTNRLKNYKCGCAHISAFFKLPSFVPKFISSHFSCHYLWRLSDVDYLIRYREFFPKIAAIELENSLKRQLEVITYLSSKV